MHPKILFSFLLGLVLVLPSAAQIQEPVKFTHEWKQLSATEAEIVFTATVEPGWHVYSTGLPDGGPIAATFNTDRLAGARQPPFRVARRGRGKDGPDVPDESEVF